MTLVELYRLGQTVRSARLWIGVALALPLSFAAIIAVGAIMVEGFELSFGFGGTLGEALRLVALLVFAYAVQNATANVINGWLAYRRSKK